MSADNVEPCACLLGVPNGARSQISIPLLIGGSGIGLLNLVRSRPEDVFSEDHRRMFSSIGCQIGDALGRVRLREELEQKGATDVRAPDRNREPEEGRQRQG